MSADKEYEQKIAELIAEIAVEKERIERKMLKQWRNLIVQGILAIGALVAITIFRIVCG